MTLVHVDSFIFDMDKITFVERNEFRESLTLHFGEKDSIEIPAAHQEKVWEFFSTKAINLFAEDSDEPHRGFGSEYR